MCDSDTGRDVLVKDTDPRDGLVGRLLFRPDGRAITVAGADAVQTWEVEGGKRLARWTYAEVNLWSDGPVVAPQPAGGGMWVNAVGQRLVRSAAYSPDGKQLALGLTVASPGYATLRDATTGAATRQFPGARESVHATAFSPDGRLLATVGYSGPVHVWDTATGDEFRQFTGHGGTILALAFSPDGRRLATGGHDTYTLLWDVPVPPPPAP